MPSNMAKYRLHVGLKNDLTMLFYIKPLMCVKQHAGICVKTKYAHVKLHKMTELCRTTWASIVSSIMENHWDARPFARVILYSHILIFPHRFCVSHADFVSPTQILCLPHRFCVHHTDFVSTTQMLCPPHRFCVHHTHSHILIFSHSHILRFSDSKILRFSDSKILTF